MYEISDDSAIETYAALKYVFEWDARLEKRENFDLLSKLTPKSSLAKNMKDYVLDGGKLYVRAGFIKIK